MVDAFFGAGLKVPVAIVGTKWKHKRKFIEGSVPEMNFRPPDHDSPDISWYFNIIRICLLPKFPKSERCLEVLRFGSVSHKKTTSWENLLWTVIWNSESKPVCVVAYAVHELAMIPFDSIILIWSWTPTRPHRNMCRNRKSCICKYLKVISIVDMRTRSIQIKKFPSKVMWCNRYHCFDLNISRPMTLPFDIWIHMRDPFGIFMKYPMTPTCKWDIYF